MLHTVKIPFRIGDLYNLLLLCLSIFIATASLATANDYTAKDFNHWLNTAYIAEATYGSDEKLASLLDRQGYTVTSSEQIAGFAVNYVLATNDDKKQHLLAIRGTANAENVMVDATFVLVHDKLTGVDIHQGFLLSARDIYQQVKPLIKPGYRLDTIGHSLGGATALVVAMIHDAQGDSVGEVITFGQPKVTNISGSRKFNHLKVTRIVTVKDMVPLVPPVDPLDFMNLSIFWHMGTEIILYKDNRYSTLSGMNSMLRAADFLNDVPSEQHLKNHFMSTYIDYLTKKLDKPEQVQFKNDFKFSDWFGSKPETTPEVTNE